MMKPTKAERLRREYQGYLTYNPLGLVLLVVGDLLWTLLTAPLRGAVRETNEQVSAWFRGTREVVQYLGDYYGDDEVRDLTRMARRSNDRG